MIDRASLLERCGGDRDLLIELLDDFVRRCDAEGEKLEHQGAELHREAHRLKGLAMNLSMESLQSAAARVEQEARSGEVGRESLQRLLTVLRESCLAARALLEEEQGG